MLNVYIITGISTNFVLSIYLSNGNCFKLCLSIIYKKKKYIWKVVYYSVQKAQ